jgi:Fe2+ or Zn2+ uptake regulation protein
VRNTIEHPITKEEVIELLEQHKHDHLKDEQCGGIDPLLMDIAIRCVRESPFRFWH